MIFSWSKLCDKLFCAPFWKELARSDWGFLSVMHKNPLGFAVSPFIKGNTFAPKIIFTQPSQVNLKAWKRFHLHKLKYLIFNNPFLLRRFPLKRGKQKSKKRIKNRESFHSLYSILVNYKLLWSWHWCWCWCWSSCPLYEMVSSLNMCFYIYSSSIFICSTSCNIINTCIMGCCYCPLISIVV